VLRLNRQPAEALGRLVVGALPFVPPLLLFALLSETGQQAGDRIKYQPEWYWKGFAVARTFMSMNLRLDVLTVAVLLVIAVALLLRGRIRFAREMLLGFGFLVLSYLVIPWKMFGAVFVDARFPAAADSGRDRVHADPVQPGLDRPRCLSHAGALFVGAQLSAGR